MSAISALKGYRTQFLYSLYRILKDYDKNYTFKPEGLYEDLDIVDEKGNYIEIIQVKNKSETLVFTDLFSKKDSFFKRANKLLESQNKAILKLVSFGHVSNELTEKSVLSKKLHKKGFDSIKIDRILKNYHAPEIVDEETLHKEIIKLLTDIRPFTNPSIAIELLIFWIYKSAEEQRKIDAKKVIASLDSIGVFLNEQKSFINQFGNTILPFDNRTLNEINCSQLEEEFYYGVSSRYEHILSNLDISRTKKLSAIDKAFKETNVVFIHGASGQGKSTLAYRYIHDFSESHTSYELKLSNNYNESYETINSLNALCKELFFPVLIYIDIKPQDVYWNDLLQQLSTKKNLQFLITIRQEDWNRVTLGADYSFKDIELTFDKTEARIIYESLSKYKRELKFTDFEESWLNFGDEGLLLEYVYLINQGDTLKARLESQINRLEEEEKVSELETLRFVCLSDSYGAKINYKKLVDFIRINRSLSSRVVKNLEKEYLLKFTENKEFLTGLHPIRSELLCGILFKDNDYIDIKDYVNDSIPLLYEGDIHAYLLNGFNFGYDVEAFLEIVKEYNFKSWIGNINVLNALLWKGVSDFLFIKNKEPFQTLYDEFGSIWALVLPYDYANVTGDEELILSNILSEDVSIRIKEIKNSISPKEDVFEYVLRWISSKDNISCELCDKKEFVALGEYSFWVGHLNLETNIVIDEHELLTLFDSEVSLKDISVLLLGLQSINFSTDFINHYRNLFVSRLMEEYSIVDLIESNDNHISCKYIIDYLKYEFEEEKEKNYLQNKSTEILEILRNAFPDKDSYSVNAVNNSFLNIELPYDPSDKNIKHNLLPLSYLVQINGLINSLFIYQFRPDSWEEYIYKIIENREKYNYALTEVIRGFQEYFRKKDYKAFIKPLELAEIELKDVYRIKFPKNIVDKWGYVSEGANEKSLNDKENLLVKTTTIASLKNYLNFNEISRDYFSSLDNTFNQLGSNILSVYRLYSDVEDSEEYNPNVLYSNISEALIKVSKFQNEFEKHFSKFCLSEKLNKIENTESRTLETLFYIWNQFYNQGKRKISSKVYTNARKEFSNIKNNLNKRFLKERKEIYDLTGIQFNVELSEKTNKTLIITAEIISETYFTSLLYARVFVQNTLGASYFSSKGVIVRDNVKSVIFLPLIYGKPINKKVFEIYTHNLDEDFDGDDWYRFFSVFDDINKELVDYLNLEFWNTDNEDIRNYEKVMGEVSNIQQFQKQIEKVNNEAKYFNFNNTGVIAKYVSKIKDFLENRKSEISKSWQSIGHLVDDKDFFNDVNSHIINSDINNVHPDISDIQMRLSEEYNSFAYLAIEDEMK
ncbi:hypothetical protein [Dokdonia sp. Asnod1-B02]|uniref:P-loop NTPase n=1 Tax=Dokdonia sp. Asnod1-B02 TaxID=3160573 RepID=UPI00386FC045